MGEIPALGATLPGQEGGTAAVMLSPRFTKALGTPRCWAPSCPTLGMPARSLHRARCGGTPHVLPEVEEGGGHPAQGLGDPPLLVGVGGAPRGWDGHSEERDAEQRLPRQTVHLDGEADPAREQPVAQPCRGQAPPAIHGTGQPPALGCRACSRIAQPNSRLCCRHWGCHVPPQCGMEVTGSGVCGEPATCVPQSSPSTRDSCCSLSREGDRGAGGLPRRAPTAH